MPVDTTYFQRFGFGARQIAVSPADDLGLVIVVPCFDEPDLISTLESLWACARPRGAAVEAVVVINSSAQAGVDVRARNATTLAQAQTWATAHPDPRVRFHFVYAPDLPPKQAGVGLARKIGMDEALRRFDEARRLREGVIACLDADCRCEPSYLQSLERHFEEHPDTPACSIYFEHPLDGPLSASIYEAAAAYELHLRYYVQALRWAGFPHAHHTVGSCMAVRAEVYRQQGGMNRRQAGEDFYFLHKLIPLGGFTDLTTTTVYPSPRPSHRVPFGTGKAVRAALEGKPPRTHSLQAFVDLKAFFDLLPLLCQRGPSAVAQVSEALPEPVRTFLPDEALGAALEEIQANTSTPAAFRKRFFRWFSGFQVMKFVHHARDRFYGDADIGAEAGQLLKWRGGYAPNSAPTTIRELLCAYRRLDREAWSSPK
jgi:hypothetical protein